MDGWLFFLEGEICDGANQVAGKRIFVIYHPIQGALTSVHPSILWDLKPAQLPSEIGTIPDENEALAFAIEKVLESYRAELLEERQRRAAIKRKYGLRSLEQMIVESDAKLIDYETRRAKGDNLPDMEVLNEQRRREELEGRKRALEEAIRRETSLLPSTPKVLGVARVIPQPAANGAMRSDAQIEAIGMQVAMAYEREHGRVPEDVSTQNLGYDIRSRTPPTEEKQAESVRYIEVKARATTGAIVLTPNEWLMAQRLGNDYWLYVVEHAASQPRLHTIQNPAARLQPEEQAEIVRYVVKNWQEASDEDR
jgi:hypothetical protein